MVPKSPENFWNVVCFACGTADLRWIDHPNETANSPFRMHNYFQNPIETKVRVNPQQVRSSTIVGAELCAGACLQQRFVVL